MRDYITLNINGCELEAHVKFDYQAEVPGVYNRAPEDCYPTEPEEWEIHELHIGDTDMSELIQFIEDEIIEELRNLDQL